MKNLTIFKFYCCDRFVLFGKRFGSCNDYLTPINRFQKICLAILGVERHNKSYDVKQTKGFRYWLASKIVKHHREEPNWVFE